MRRGYNVHAKLNNSAATVKRIGLYAVILYALLLIPANLSRAIVTVPENQSENQKCILIDAGHGGVDGGASGKSGVLEKDINLSITKKLKALLEKEGYKVQLMREEDMGLYTDDGSIRKKKLEDLANRCRIIKESNADLFISIHLNAFPQTQYYGAQVWYAGNDVSRKFANMLQMNFREDLDKSNDRKCKPGGNAYKILKDVAGKPAVICECGFLSNIAEEIKLREESYQQQISGSIVKSVNMYFGKGTAN